MLDLADGPLAADCRAGLRALTEHVTDLRRRRPGDLDEREAIIVIRTPAYEGTRLADAYEGSRWAEHLYSQYVSRAEREGRPVQTFSKDAHVDPYGFAATTRIGGVGAFGWLQPEQGTHRAEGRRILEAQVEVLAVAVSYDEIPLDDREIEANETPEWSSCGGPLGYDCRSVLLTHVPTGITALCMKQGSTKANREGARTLLRARLLEHRRNASDQPR